MNGWTLLAFVVGVGLGLLVGVFATSLCVVAARADEESYQGFRDEWTGRLD